MQLKLKKIAGKSGLCTASGSDFIAYTIVVDVALLPCSSMFRVRLSRCIFVMCYWLIRFDQFQLVKILWYTTHNIVIIDISTNNKQSIQANHNVPITWDNFEFDIFERIHIIKNKKA